MKVEDLEITESINTLRYLASQMVVPKVSVQIKENVPV